MVYGVILGALLHLGVQIPALLHYGFRWHPGLGLRDPGVSKVLRLMGPRLLSMLSLHVYFLARDRFASFYQEGGVSALNNGWFIMQLPETLFGTAIAIALLPSLSEFFNRHELEKFQNTVNRALRAMLALSLPAAALLAVNIRLLVEIGFNFEPAETEMVVGATRAFLLGLVVTPGWSRRAVVLFSRIPIAMLSSFLQIGLHSLAMFLSSTGLTGIALLTLSPLPQASFADFYQIVSWV
jgi:putative peptidoglycan lipid II flippase